MPIALPLRKFYRTQRWFEARGNVRKRAGGHCEWCGKPGGDVKIADDGTGRWFNEETSQWMRPPAFDPPNALGSRLSLEMLPPRNTTWLLSVLTTAHLDHNPEDDEHDERRLACLCQRCHFIYDGPHHRQTARLRRDRETGQLRLELVA